MLRLGPHLIRGALTLLAPVVAAGDLTLEIHHLLDGEPVDLHEGRYQVASGETISVTRLSYLLSGPAALRREENEATGEWLSRNDWFALVEGSGQPATIRIAGLPTGRYREIRFHVGLDRTTDEADPNQYPAGHPLNPVRNNLHWTPQGGYIYLALEGHLLRESNPSGFSYHLGNHWNRTEISLTGPFDLDGDTTIALEFHLERLFAGDPPLAIAGQPSTHSRAGDPVAARLRTNLQQAFSIREVRTTARVGKVPPTTEGTPDLVGTPYRFRIPQSFPLPDLPVDFPLTEERVALGARLFHETLLSRSNQQSCASCHQHGAALSDPRQFSIGDQGTPGTRNSMPLFNLAWKSSFFWDGRSPSLRDQALVPIQSSIEMHETLDHVITELESHDTYPRLFYFAFGSPAITTERLGIAIEQFLLTQTSFDSRFDRAARGEEELGEQERRGFELFMTEYDPRRGLLGADCFHCHGGAFFTDHRFHNNGLLDEDDPGLALRTGQPGDRNKFITPSLRNIALTAPYMHDGRFGTLEEVVEHYDSGLHRSETLDPNLAKHPVDGLGLSASDKAALVAFLKALTDPQYAR